MIAGRWPEWLATPGTCDLIAYRRGAVGRPCSRTRISAVLFDVDGTLVDTNYLHVVTWWEVFRHTAITCR